MCRSYVHTVHTCRVGRSTSLTDSLPPSFLSLTSLLFLLPFFSFSFSKEGRNGLIEKHHRLTIIATGMCRNSHFLTFYCNPNSHTTLICAFLVYSIKIQESSKIIFSEEVHRYCNCFDPGVTLSSSSTS